MRRSSRGSLLLAMVLLSRSILVMQPLIRAPALVPPPGEGTPQPPPPSADGLRSKYGKFVTRKDSWNFGTYTWQSGPTLLIAKPQLEREVATVTEILNETKFRVRHSWKTPLLVGVSAAAGALFGGAIATAAAGGTAASVLVHSFFFPAVNFAAMGDPTICPLDPRSKEPIQSECVEYTGPAVVTCFSRDGDMETIDFVGVCDENGDRCMARDAYWVGEVWRFDTITGRWKYRDFRGTHKADVSCGGTWTSEQHRLGMKQPDDVFIDAFHGSRSFLLHARQERVIEGPAGPYISSTLMDRNLKTLQYDKDGAKPWIEAGLLMLGYAKAMEFNNNIIDNMRRELFRLAYANRLVTVPR